MAKFSQYDIRILNASRESRFAYWNALLTLNGILITVFSGIAFIIDKNRWFIFILVCCSIVSAALLIMNFVAMKEHYKNLALLDVDVFDKMTPDDNRIAKETAGTEHEWMERRESIVQSLLFVQGFLIVLLLLK